jgi:transposase
MSEIKLVAVDLAKRCYQVAAFDVHNKVLYNRKYSAAKFALQMHQLEPTVIAMEACGTAHYWGRKLQALGHEVRLVPAQHTKAFRRVHKSDGHDTVSIGEAAQRPNLHFVPVKSVMQQDLQVLGRIREQLVSTRTGLINQVRGLAREYGVNFGKQRSVLMAQLPQALEEVDNGLSPVARAALAGQLEQIRYLDDRLKQICRQLHELASEDPAYQRLLSIPGIGPTIAPALLASVGHAQHLQSARGCAAWAGLVPKQHGTGGQVRLGRITKNGQKSLRALMIHGARSVIRWAHRYTHEQSQWLEQLIARAGKNKAAVALANKMMRIAWAVLRHEESFDMRKAFRPQPAAALS